MEFGLIAIPFFLIGFATFDLGRFFITEHSVRTLTSELARATLVYCANQPTGSVCTLPAAGTQSVQSAEAKVPFLIAGGFAAGPTASRSAANTSTGVMTITASTSYNFSFIMPVWRSVTQVSQTTQLSY
jgi:Flp pilus assembly protein TadG